MEVTQERFAAEVAQAFAAADQGDDVRILGQNGVAYVLHRAPPRPFADLERHFGVVEIGLAGRPVGEVLRERQLASSDR